MAVVSSTPLLSPLNCTLYVGDLAPNVSETVIHQLFTRASFPIKSVRVCRDCRTGQSLGYAYVNFYSHNDASKAMDCLNHTYLYDKPMRMMWSQRNPITRKTAVGNLFVKNLDASVDSAGLEREFRRFGAILSSKVVEENGISKGFGFVQFVSEESAVSALKALHGSLLNGKKIHVSTFIRKNERQEVSKDPTVANLYVNNLDEDMTEDSLREKFSEFGKLRSVAVAKDDQGKPKGFGFVCFESQEEADKAVASMNGAQLGSKKIFVGKAQKKAERRQLLKPQFEKLRDSNVYIKNLDESIDDVKLREVFSTCGQIVSAKVMRCENGISKGFGFVCFSTPEDANKAIDKFHRTMLQGKPLYVGIAQHKVDRLESFFSSLCGLNVQQGYSSNSFHAPNINSGYSCPTEHVGKTTSVLEWLSTPHISCPDWVSLRQFTNLNGIAPTKVGLRVSKKASEENLCREISNKGLKLVSKIGEAPVF